MLGSDQDKPTDRLAGYTALIAQYDLDVIPNWHRSLVLTRGTHRINTSRGIVEEGDAG